MRNVNKYSIFISHASENRILAKKLQHFLENSLKKKPGIKLVFCTSDIKAIEGGADWYEEIIRALRTSSVCLSLITPESIYKPWVIFESGGAYATCQVKNKKLICILAKGVKPGDSNIPSIYTPLQPIDLSSPEGIKKLITELGKKLRTSKKCDDILVIKLAKAARYIERSWDGVKPTLVAEQAQASPFDARSALKIAKEHLIFVGQNLDWISKSDKCHQGIIEFLKKGKKKKRRVEILISDIRKKASVQAWSEINPQIKESGYTYEEHLRNAFRKFRKLISECNKARIKGLDVRVTSLVPLGFTVIDPNNSNGILTLQPVINYGNISGERPQFIIKKSLNTKVFDYYWRRIEMTFGNAKKLL